MSMLEETISKTIISEKLVGRQTPIIKLGQSSSIGRKRYGKMRKAFSILCLLLTIVFVLTTPSHVAAATPTITLSPTSGYAGASVTIQGSNLPIDPTSTGYTVTFNWDKDVLKTVPSPVVVGKIGSFSTTFTVPSTAIVGVHNVTATIYVPLQLGGRPVPVTTTSQFTVLQPYLIKPINPILPIIPTIPITPLLPTSPTPTASPSPSIIGALASPNTNPILTPSSPTPTAITTAPADLPPVASPAPPAATPPSGQTSVAPGDTNNTPPATATPIPSLIAANPLAPVGGQLSAANQNNPTPSTPTDAKEDSSQSGFPIFAIVAILAVVILLVLVLKKQFLG
jgi:hypothetical protein